MKRSTIAFAVLALAVLAASVADAKLRGAKEARIVPRKPRALLATRELDLGYPENGQVDDGAYNDYYLSWLDIEFPLTIQVSTNTGDADLYVGCGDYYTDGDYPSASKGALWQSNNAGPDDSVTIQSRSDMSACPNPSTDDILIGVLGFLNSTYTIMAHAGADAEELYDAETVSDGVDSGDYEYFSYSDMSGDVEITLTSYDDGSDADLYVNCMGDPKPSTSNSLWSSAAGSGDDVVDVSMSDSNFCADGFQIAVYGFRAGTAGEAMFDITASSGASAEALYSGWPVDGHVDDDQYVYYSYEPSGWGGAKITVTSSGGDADVYTACSNEALPTKTTHDRSSEAAGSTPDIITYTSSDSDFCTDTEIMIGVYGFMATSYTVEAEDTSTGDKVVLSPRQQ